MIAPGLHASWREVDPAAWSWPHFTARELACKCARHCEGEYFHVPALLDRLEELRGRRGPLQVNSGRRCPLHNAEVGGAPLSQHKLSMAVDIATGGHDPKALAIEAAELGFTGIGFGRTFLHLDMRAHRAGFHYPGGRGIWTARFGFDPAVMFKATGKLQSGD